MNLIVFSALASEVTLRSNKLPTDPSNSVTLFLDFELGLFFSESLLLILVFLILPEPSLGVEPSAQKGQRRQAPGRRQHPNSRRFVRRVKDSEVSILYLSYYFQLCLVSILQRHLL